MLVAVVVARITVRVVQVVLVAVETLLWLVLQEQPTRVAVVVLRVVILRLRLMLVVRVLSLSVIR
jgi:hypothetical protein